MAKRTFVWDKDTKLSDLPKWLTKLMPPYTDLDGLDDINQIDHVRFRVLHEIDIHEEKQEGYDDMTKTQYRKALEFLEATGGRKE